MTDSTSKKLIIVGAGGGGVEAAWIATEAGWKIIGFADDNPQLWETKVDGFPVLCGTSVLGDRYSPREHLVHVAIGSNKQRRRATERLISSGFRFCTLTH